MKYEDSVWKDLYCLDENKRPRKCRSYEECKNTERRVAIDRVGDVTVSTVFLQHDHNWSSSNRPVLFETMVFGGPLDEEQWRYCTWEEAEAGHAEVLARVIAEHPPENEHEI